MTVYSYSQLEGLWIQAGGSRTLAPLMAAIALAESSGNSNALNLTDNGGTQTSVGLWQVSNGTHNYPAAWATPLGNAREAVAKYNSQGLSAWGTYTSGAYKAFLHGGVPPNLNIGGAGGGGGPQTTSILGSLGGDIFGSFLNDIANQLGLSSVKDLFIRMGLILLGAALIIVALVTIVGRETAQQVAVLEVGPRAKGAANAAEPAST